MRVIERTVDKRGQRRLTPAIALEGGWTRLALSEDEVIDRYTDQGASEPFHSAFKTDRAIERLPSGKLATHAWVLAVSTARIQPAALDRPKWVTEPGFSQKQYR
jgi:hypothetical protein